jgi:hypothetical protein
MIVHSIKDLSNTKVVSLLEVGLSKTVGDSLVNYHPDYRNDTSNIFYLLNTGRFQQGNYYVLESNGQYIGSSGWYPYASSLALILVRSFLPKGHRANYYMSEFFMPRFLEETADFSKLWITMNDHNKIIYNAFERMSEGKSVGWPDSYKLFKPIGQRTVNNVQQYVVEYLRP